MESFYRLIRFFRKEMVELPKFKVRRCQLPNKLDGDCTKNNDKFQVRIDKNLPEYYAIDVLIHELAHALAWNETGDPHNNAWGVAYSRVYRKFLDFIQKEKNNSVVKIEECTNE